MVDHPAAEASDVTRSFRLHGFEVRALDAISMSLPAGAVTAVMGPSGSGKSTLLFLLCGLDAPDRGTVSVAGVDWSTLGTAERPGFRRRHCGFIVQGMALLPQATAAENVEVPLLLDAVDVEQRQQRVRDVLERVDLLEHARKLPDQLSGGQQQRVSIARALVTRPAVVLADEPTANLDSATGQAVTRLLIESAREQGAAVLLVTHDPAVAAYADEVMELHSGRFNRAPVERAR
jgi:putative ABC transport system ATP-binding protein